MANTIRMYDEDDMFIIEDVFCCIELYWCLYVCYLFKKDGSILNRIYYPFVGPLLNVCGTRYQPVHFDA